ncbi:MAG: FoF1 ATP synthase subunit a, partial [Candidatus Omnitrophota bacterium]
MSVSHQAAAETAQSAKLEVLNFVELIVHYMGETPPAALLKRFENEVFQGLVISALALIFFMASRRSSLVPGRLQSACEMIVEGLDGFVCGILGPAGRKYTPFLGSLFLYVLSMNLIGLLPLMKSPTSSSMTLHAGAVTVPIPTVTVALAIVVFFYVQFLGIRNLGIVGYLDHMAGSPRDVIGAVMSPLMLVIHVIGELAKPFSLAFRLFCNLMGEDVLIAVFIGLGVAAAFIPLQAPFVLFAMITSTMQAFVFTLLSTVYIAM